MTRATDTWRRRAAARRFTKGQIERATAVREEGVRRASRTCFACHAEVRARVLGEWSPPAGKLEAELLRRSGGNRSHTCSPGQFESREGAA